MCPDKSILSGIGVKTKVTLAKCLGSIIRTKQEITGSSWRNLDLGEK